MSCEVRGSSSAGLFVSGKVVKQLEGKLHHPGSVFSFCVVEPATK
jgi:hypothetical protein